MKYFILLLFTLTSFSQNQKEIYNKSIKAYQSKEYKEFLKLTKSLDSIRPSHPTYMYNLACAYALNNELENSILTLKKCILNNSSLDFESENDLYNIKNSSSYTEIIQLKENLKKKVSNSDKVIQLTEKDLHPEGLIYLKKQNTWLATSIHKNKIISFDIKTGICKNWLNENNLLAIFSIKADAQEKYLWAVCSATPEMNNYNETMKNKSEIIQIDISKNKIINRFFIDGNHILGDLVIDKNNNVYISDSNEPRIYKISNNKLETWLDLTSEAYNLQGITIDNENNQIYIADYLKGILRISIKNQTNREWLNFPEYTTSKGIDGLLYYNNSLIAIHNGLKPIRLMKYVLENQQIKTAKIIEINNPDFNEPTLGTLKGNLFYFFSNVPWSAYDEKYQLIDAKFAAPILYHINLD